MNILDLRKLQAQGPIDVLSALRSVVINPIEICNRTCVFCHRSVVDVDITQQYKIKLDLITKIANDLKDIGYANRIGLNGSGEPTLHEQLVECLSILKNTVTDIKWLEIQTNGDYLTREKIKEYCDAGCNTLSISMYDQDDTEKFNAMAKDIPIQVILRHHYDKTVNYNLHLVNRVELVKKESAHLNIESPCYLPFYKFYIDWNGDVRICNNDVGKASLLGNIYNESIRDVWLGENLNVYRKNLLVGNRKACTPCNRCDINGTLLGKESADIFQKELA